MNKHSDEVVDRVAEAIFNAQERIIVDGGLGKMILPWSSYPEEYKDMTRRQARAALDAIDALYEDEGEA